MTAPVQDLDAQDLLVRDVRVVALDEPAGGEALSERLRDDDLVDLRIVRGVLTEIGPALECRGQPVLDAGGRWAVPGLWDAHVHLQQWARSRERLDVAGTDGPQAVTRRVAAHVASLPDDDTLVVGFGQRTASWSTAPTVAELDAVSGAHPVVLVSGDAHHGWLNSRALALLGLPPQVGPVEEAPWFAVFPRLEALLPSGVAAARAAAQDAAARGVVGIGDMEWERGVDVWPGRVADGVDLLRVRTATYADGLDDVLARGHRSGTVLPGSRGLVEVGPLKVIFDGSVNTRTAYCCAPYPGPPGSTDWRGLLNLELDELVDLCRRAHDGGLRVAVHAIGDAATGLALDALELSGARGSVEHVQLVDAADVGRFARLGVTASVQPAHLLDDRDVSVRLWPDRQGTCFALRSLLDAGTTLALGSDAPVAPLDPWLAMAAAVHRSADDREPWTPGEALTPREALAASTDGQRLRPGARGDLVLLDDDPLGPTAVADGPSGTGAAGRPGGRPAATAGDSAAAARRLREVRVSATVLGGRLTHGG